MAASNDFELTSYGEASAQTTQRPPSMSVSEDSRAGAEPTADPKNTTNNPDKKTTWEVLNNIWADTGDRIAKCYNSKRWDQYEPKSTLDLSATLGDMGHSFQTTFSGIYQSLGPDYPPPKRGTWRSMIPLLPQLTPAFPTIWPKWHHSKDYNWLISRIVMPPILNLMQGIKYVVIGALIQLPANIIRITQRIFALVIAVVGTPILEITNLVISLITQPIMKMIAQRITQVVGIMAIAIAGGSTMLAAAIFHTISPKLYEIGKSWYTSIAKKLGEITDTFNESRERHDDDQRINSRARTIKGIDHEIDKLKNSKRGNKETNIQQLKKLKSHLSALGYTKDEDAKAKTLINDARTTNVFAPSIGLSAIGSSLTHNAWAFLETISSLFVTKIAETEGMLARAQNLRNTIPVIQNLHKCLEVDSDRKIILKDVDERIAKLESKCRIAGRRKAELMKGLLPGAEAEGKNLENAYDEYSKQIDHLQVLKTELKKESGIDVDKATNAGKEAGIFFTTTEEAAFRKTFIGNIKKTCQALHKLALSAQEASYSVKSAMKKGQSALADKEKLNNFIQQYDDLYAGFKQHVGEEKRRVENVPGPSADEYIKLIENAERGQTPSTLNDNNNTFTIKTANGRDMVVNSHDGNPVSINANDLKCLSKALPPGTLKRSNWRMLYDFSTNAAKSFASTFGYSGLNQWECWEIDTTKSNGVLEVAMKWDEYMKEAITKVDAEYRKESTLEQQLMTKAEHNDETGKKAAVDLKNYKATLEKARETARETAREELTQWIKTDPVVQAMTSGRNDEYRTVSYNEAYTLYRRNPDNGDTSTTSGYDAMKAKAAGAEPGEEEHSAPGEAPEEKLTPV